MPEKIRLDVTVNCAGVSPAQRIVGKDGVLYTGNADALGNTQPGDLVAGRFATNYGKLRMPPILYTYFDPAVPPAPASPTQLNLFPGGATRHLHGTPLLFSSAIHGTMHFVGGENSALRFIRSQQECDHRGVRCLVAVVEPG